MSDIYPRATHPAIEMPEYAPGLKVETERDLATMTTGYDVSLFIGRKVNLDDTLAMRSDGEAARELVRQAVRQMQDEAVTALGLNHWKNEVRQEVQKLAREAAVVILQRVMAEVRKTDTVEAAALVVLDELEEVRLGHVSGL